MASLGDLQELGRRAFASKRYEDAFQLFAEAYNQQQQQPSQQSPREIAVLASNCAAALLKLDRPQAALAYARAATQASPDWPKAWYRLAAAHSALQQHGPAAQALSQAAALLTPEQASEAQDVRQKLQAAQAATASLGHHQHVQAGLAACHLAWATNSAREVLGREALLLQLQQGIAGCSWEPQDWEWRPTWTPSMRWPSSDEAAAGPAAAGAAAQPPSDLLLQPHLAGPGGQQVLQLLAGMTQSLADLEAAQRALKLLQDEPLLSWYKTAIEQAVADKGSQATVLVLAHGGGGVLGLLAAAAGAQRVVVVERGLWGFRASQLLLEDSRRDGRADLVARVQLVPCALGRCRCAASRSDGAGGAAGASAAAADAVDDEGGSGEFWLQQPAAVLVTDMFDYSVLGQGVLPSIATAAAAGLLARDVLVVPHEVRCFGQLVSSRLLTQPVSGFDLREVDSTYAWHPTMAMLEHSRYQHLQHLSPPAQLCTLQLHRQAREQGVLSCREDVSVLETCSTAVRQGSSPDALLVWCEFASQAGSSISTGPAELAEGSATSSSGSMGLVYWDSPLAASAAAQTVSITTSQQHQLRLHFDVHVKATWAAAGQEEAIVATSPEDWSWAPHGKPRHASLPRWHFDMLADLARNSSYDAAIRRAVARISAAKAAAGLTGAECEVTALDIGTGTGLLAMMAARAGAARVTAVESVRHLAQAATSIVARNGLSSRIDIVHKDGRYMKLGQDMQSPADLLVFEVFDCGCIGEGALHIVAAAKPLLRPGATILPQSTKVFCQPIQFRRGVAAAAADVCGCSRSLFRWQWQPDYFEADLRHGLSQGDGPQQWKPLAQPQLAFAFDFAAANPIEAFQPGSRRLSFTADSGGICNAVAVWFELQLDEATCLSSSPYTAPAGLHPPTWKQAVQMLPEHRVSPGQLLELTAEHDTYAISFSLQATAAAGGSTHSPAAVVAGVAVPAAAGGAPAASEPAGRPTPTGVPPFDPPWRQGYDRLVQLQASLAKAMSQDPAEHRRLAAAATLLAMRPWGTGGGSSRTDEAAGGATGAAGANNKQPQLSWPAADPHHASALLVRLMG